MSSSMVPSPLQRPSAAKSAALASAARPATSLATAASTKALSTAAGAAHAWGSAQTPPLHSAARATVAVTAPGEYAEENDGETREALDS